MPIYFTPEHGAYFPANQETHVHLTLLSGQLSPAKITLRLGLEPDEQWKLGARIRPRSRGTHKWHGWVLASTGPDDDAPVEEHLTDLLERLNPRTAQLRELIAESGALVSAKLWIAHRIENFNPGFSLSPEHLGQIAALGVEVAVDIYVHEPGELGPPQPLRIGPRPKPPASPAGA